MWLFWCVDGVSMRWCVVWIGGRRRFGLGEGDHVACPSNERDVPPDMCAGVVHHSSSHATNLCNLNRPIHYSLIPDYSSHAIYQRTEFRHDTYFEKNNVVHVAHQKKIR
jgi:hypothetical protein